MMKHFIEISSQRVQGLLNSKNRAINNSYSKSLRRSHLSLPLLFLSCLLGTINPG